MTAYVIKRTKTNINRASVGIVGPVDIYGTPLPNAKWQELKFGGPEGNLAIVNLISESRYKIGVDMWGEKGGTLLLEKAINPAGPFSTITTFTIPNNASGPKTHIGYYHWDTFIFIA
jgi:hypothetical protein